MAKRPVRKSNASTSSTTRSKTTRTTRKPAATKTNEEVANEIEDKKEAASKTSARRKTTATKSTATKKPAARRTSTKAKETAKETTTPRKSRSSSTATRKTPAKTFTRKTVAEKKVEPETKATTRSTRKTATSKTSAKTTAAKKTTTSKAKSSASTTRKTSTTKPKTTRSTKSSTTTRRKTPARKTTKKTGEEIVVTNEAPKVSDTFIEENEIILNPSPEPIIEPAVSEESLIHEAEAHKAPPAHALTESQSSFGETYGSYGDEDEAEPEYREIFSYDEAISVIEPLIPDCLKYRDCVCLRYIEGENLIVKDRYNNRYRFWVKHSDNELLEPEVDLLYAVLPVNHRKGDEINTQRIAVLDNKHTAHKILSELELYSRDESEREESHEGDEIHSPVVDDELIKAHSGQSDDGGIKGGGAIFSAFHDASTWAKNENKKTVALVTVLAVIVIALGIGGYQYHSKQPEFAPVTHNTAAHKSIMSIAGSAAPQYVNLSPSETHIKSLNTIISEITRIQNGQPVQGKVGSEIIQRHFQPEQLAALKAEIQKQVTSLIQEEGEMNAGMGLVEGNQVPYSSQTDRYGTSNVPPLNSWASATGAHMGVPPASQNVSNVRDLDDFGLKVH